MAPATRFFVMLSVLTSTCAVRAQSTRPATIPSTRPALDQAALERQFAATMTGAILVGRSSDTARPDAQSKQDRYIIERVSKVTSVPGAGGDNDRWLFICRIQFGQKDVAVPLIIPVKWAGDTPMISVTDMTIPGFGTYNARVIIYRDQYAGTWSGRTHGGHLWGRIERAPTTRAATTRSAAP